MRSKAILVSMMLIVLLPCTIERAYAKNKGRVINQGGFVSSREHGDTVALMITFKKNVTTPEQARAIIEGLFGSDIEIKKEFKLMKRGVPRISLLVESAALPLRTLRRRLKKTGQVRGIQPVKKLMLPERSFQQEPAEEKALINTARGPVNPTAPNTQTQHLSGDFTDTDADGMTDAAEIKYGFDPDDPLSFPQEPELVAVEPVSVSIPESGIGARYEYYAQGEKQIDIKWINPEGGKYFLRLTNTDTGETLYYGGHYSGYAPVNYSEFGLQGDELLEGCFYEYDDDGQFVRYLPYFTIDLATVNISDPVVGVPDNRIGYTFVDFPAEQEQLYREFLKRVWPIMYAYLGSPAESFNCEITNMGEDTNYFMITNKGRTFLSDTDFIPRLIVHEFVHAWKGWYTFTSDESWEYDDKLSGFEEATAEGMAFEIIHEYVRSYPNDSATLQLLDWRPYQYWSACSVYYDSIKYIPWTGAGAFWTHGGSETARYSIAATTFQYMAKENPDCYKEIMQLYFNRINSDRQWRSNREDILDMWTAVVPEINQTDTRQYLDAIPVFQGHKLDEGVYVLSTIRAYGNFGEQFFAMSYVPMDGRVYWGILKSEMEDYNIPSWINYVPGGDAYNYIDTQNEPFTVDVYDAAGLPFDTYNDITNVELREDGTPNGFGWKDVEQLDMGYFPLGLYREEVSFDNYLIHDQGAKEVFYFFGYDGLDQDKNSEYVLMVGIDGVDTGEMTVNVDGVDYSAPINNGLAVFRSETWPFDLETALPITVINSAEESHTYYRRVIEAGTYHSYFQHQFIIVDRDFNGIEDVYEAGEVNSDPVLDPIGDKTVAEGDILEFSLSATDADGDTLTFSADNLPVGAVFDTQTALFSWTPGFDQAGIYAVNFSVNDGKGGVDGEEVAVSVSEVDITPPTTPVVSDEGDTTEASDRLSAGWVSSDLETGVAEYRYAIGTAPGATDVVSWTSAGADTSVTHEGLSLNEGVTYYFSVKAANGEGLWSEEGYSDGISLDVNHAPVLDAIDDQSLAEGSSVDILITATDPDNDPVTITVSGLTGFMSFADNTLSVAPGYADAGNYTIQVQASDGILSDSRDVLITVTEAAAELFYDSFEVAEWNGLWQEDSQDDWFRSNQIAADGSFSAAVNGRASEAELTSIPIDLLGSNSANISFSWYINNRLDRGEYVAFDVSLDGGNSWMQKSILNGRVDQSNVWHTVSLDVGDITSLRIRFRAKMSLSNEMAYVDRVKIVTGQ